MVIIPTQKRNKVKCNSTAFLALLLLPLVLIYLVLLKHYFGNSTRDGISDNDGSLRNHKQLSQQQNLQLSHTEGHQRSIQSVQCQKYAKDKTIFNPNKQLSSGLKRLTVTEPKFWISVNHPGYDKLRFEWVMKRGDYYEQGLTDLFHQILTKYDTTTKPPPLMLDIGANIGWFSLYSRAHGHDVASIEPNPTMFLRICESLEYNSWDQESGDTSFSLWNYGLGEIPGKANLTIGNNPGASSFHEDRFAQKFVRKKIEVPVATLDSIAMQEGWLGRQISVMKVDVEGFENFIFEGGKKLIYNGNVENIVMESSIHDVATVGGMVDLLYDAGYRLKEIRSVNGEKYHEDWWHTFNPMLEERYSKKLKNIHVAEADESNQIKFLAKVTCNIWWQHQSIESSS